MLVETSALTKRYPALTALDDCTLQVEQGEVFGLLGPNGAGKTTLLRLLMGFLTPTSGCAHIEGLDCSRDKVAVHRRVAYLPGDARLFRQMRGRETLAFFAGLRRDGSLKTALALADRLALDLNRQVANMSTGMRQKLALCSVLAADTPLVILDEPTANLDPTVRGEVIALVREARTAGRTIVFSSHVLSEVEDACNRVVILRQGKIVHAQVMADLRRQHRIRARLTGAMPTLPESLRGELAVSRGLGGQITIETPGELAPLLGFLATLPVDEMRIEPVGLRAVYDTFHPSTAV